MEQQNESLWQALVAFFTTIRGKCCFMFSKHVGCKESNEAEVLAILKALRIFSHCFQDKVIVESDLANAIS